MLIQTYLYSNKVTVYFLDQTNFKTRNRVVYSRPITIYQGIDNPMQVVVKNQDQKAVDLTGYSVMVTIQDPVAKLSVKDYPLTWVDVAAGRGTFTFDRDTIDSLEQRIYHLTFKRVSDADQSETPMYIDDNFTVPVDLIIKPAYYQSPGL